MTAVSSEEHLTFGHEEGDDEPGRIANLVKAVCPGWVNASNIEVKDYSAFGGSKVYKVSADSAEPPSVALRVDVTEGDDDTLQDERTQAIGLLLSQINMAPTKIVHGENWNIEEWSGVGVSKDFSHFDESLASPAELATLMANFHRVRTDWYEEYRQRMCERYAFLSTIPQDAPIWNGAAYGWENGMFFTGGQMTPEKEEYNKKIFGEMVATGVTQKLLTCKAFYPVSAAAKKVVTIHGDFKPNNIIRTPNQGCMCIDYDFTHVSPVQQELSFAYMKWLGPKHQDFAFRYAFLEMYLKESEQPHDEAAIKALMLDAEIGMICNFDGLLFSGLSKEIPLLRDGTNGPSGHDLIELLEKFVENVRGSSCLTEQVICNGLVPTLYTKTSGPLKLWLEQMRNRGSLGVFGIYPDLGTWQEMVKVKGVRIPWLPNFLA